MTVRRERRPLPETSPAWEEVAALFRDPVSPEVVEPYQFVFDSPQVRASFELADYALESFPKGTPCSSARGIDTAHLHGFQIRSKATTVATPLEEVVESDAVCVRISRIWASRVCGRWGCQRAT